MWRIKDVVIIVSIKPIKPIMPSMIPSNIPNNNSNTFISRDRSDFDIMPSMKKPITMKKGPK